MKVKILTVGAPMKLVDDGLREHFDVQREATPGVREIRGIAVSGGHQRIDAAFIAPFAELEIVSSFGVG